MRPINLLIAFVLGVALAAGIWVSTNMLSANKLPTTATVLPTTSALPDVSLVDHDGREIDAGIFRGQWDLVFFGFTSCPDVCPITLKVLSDAQDALREEGQSPLPRIVLVSVDPERDTPERMATYMNAFGVDSLGITGELDEIRKLTGSLGIFFEKRETESEVYTVDHSSVVLVIDPNGEFHSLFSSPHKSENFVYDLPLLMGR